MKALYVASLNKDSGSRLSDRRLTAIMSRPVITVSMHMLLGDALLSMMRGGLRHLAVVDDAGKCVGVLSDRAVASAWARDPGCLSYRRVSTAVDPAPPLLGEGATALDAARMMRRLGTDAVAVVDVDDVPVGMVTGSDLVGLLAD